MPKAKKRLESQPVGRPPLVARQAFRSALLREWMEREGISAQGLSQALEGHGQSVSHWTIYKWCRGDSRPSRSVRVALAKLMKLRSHRMLNG